jgi:hypothetical protein
MTVSPSASRISTRGNAGWYRVGERRTGASRSFAPRSERRYRARRFPNGKIVHLDAEGRPRFYDLMRRRIPQHYYAFDLLWLHGRDLRELPHRQGCPDAGQLSPSQPHRDV